MSVQSEITRISGNVAAALAAIAEKGVSVPPGSKSDALASLIAAIEGGGNSGGNIEVVSFTAAETGVHTIEIDSTDTPAAIMCRRDSFVRNDDAHKTDKNEVPFCASVVREYSSAGVQNAIWLYNSSTTSFSGSAKTSNTSVNSTTKASSSTPMIIAYNASRTIFSVYVAAAGSLGLRVGETYTLVCLYKE